MKINVLGILFTALIIASCGESKEQKEIAVLKAEIESLKNENDSLRSGDAKMQVSIQNFTASLKEIEQNLASIDENKTMLAKLSGEMNDEESLKENINNRIAKIKELMQNSKLKILSLDKALVKLRQESGEKSAEILELDQKIKLLINSLVEKDSLIANMDDEMFDMEALYALEKEVTAELTNILNRAYFLMGSPKDLLTKGVVSKEGGFIGLGKIKVINANASDSLFTRIKKDRVDEIYINAKKAKLISNHPEGSYSFVKNDGVIEVLQITDKELFWKEGNYLVVEVEK